MFSPPPPLGPMRVQILWYSRYIGMYFVLRTIFILFIWHEKCAKTVVRLAYSVNSNSAIGPPIYWRTDVPLRQ